MNLKEELVEMPGALDEQILARAIQNIPRSKRTRIQNAVDYNRLGLPEIKDTSLVDMLKYRRIKKGTLRQLAEALRQEGIHCVWMFELDAELDAEELTAVPA